MDTPPTAVRRNARGAGPGFGPVAGTLAALCFGAAAYVLLPDRAIPAAPTRVVVLDVSASVTRRSPSASRRMRAVLAREADAAVASGEEVLVVATGAGARRLYGPGAPGPLLELLEGRAGSPLDPTAAGPGGGARSAELETDLAQGLRLVEELTAGRTGSLCLLGDGTYTGDGPAPRIERLARLGLAWRGLERIEPERWDAALLELSLPPRVEPGAPVAARAVVLLRPAGDTPAAVPVPELELRIALVRPGLRSHEEHELSLVPGVPTPVTLELGAFPTLPPGRVRVQARVCPASSRDAQDPISENDSLERVVEVGETLVVGIVGSAPLAPAPAGVEFVALSPSELASELADLDAVAVLDAPLDELPAAVLSSYVRSGGGLLVAGGLRTLSGWSPEPMPGEVADLLPLVPDDGGGEPRRVVVLVDGSGSMEGPPFELVREAVGELVRAAPPSDEVELAFFTAVLQPSTYLGTGGGRGNRADVAARLLATRVPGGSTRIVESLEQLARGRSGADERALVLLLTDGREAGDVVRVGGRAREVREALAAARTELLVFAVGEQADLEVLAQLAGGEENVRSARELERLAELFRSEVNRERVLEGTHEVLALSGGLADNVATEGARPPAVKRMLRCRARAGAAVALATPSGDPLLALAREGRGRSAVFAALPSSDWAPRYSFEGQLAPLLRWLVRRPDAQPPRVVLAGERLAVRGIDGRSWRVGATLRLGTGDDADAIQLELLRDPATDLLVAALPNEARRRTGTALLELRAGGEALVLPFALPRPREFREPTLRLAEASLRAASPAAPGSVPAGLPRSGSAGPVGAVLLILGLVSALGAGLSFRRGRAAGRQGIQTSGR